MMPSEAEIRAAAHAEVAGQAVEQIIALGLRATHPSISEVEAMTAAQHLIHCALAAAEEARGTESARL